MKKKLFILILTGFINISYQYTFTGGGAKAFGGGLAGGVLGGVIGGSIARGRRQEPAVVREQVIVERPSQPAPVYYQAPPPQAQLSQQTSTNNVIDSLRAENRTLRGKLQECHYDLEDQAEETERNIQRLMRKNNLLQQENADLKNQIDKTEKLKIQDN